MTDTLDGTLSPALGASTTGVVGNRQLIAVQTFDIARLTTYPVPLVPGTFILVTGQGPKGDSNGSGKTSFLAAVSLLHAEAQWRLETDGGRHACGLLFKPAAAGVADANYRPADHGYIVGVFAHPAHPDDGQLTVWLRINVSAPFIQARHTNGLWVAHGDTDQERYERADALWEGLSRGGTIGSKKLSGLLYGDAPRCMAYLDTTLRSGAPSLLSQQMTEMTPERIGESLIALTGREGLLDHELEQRRLFADQHHGLRDKAAYDKQTRVEEAAELSAVEDRDRSRSLLAGGEHLWRLHFARGFLDATDADTRLAATVEAAAAAVASAKVRIEQAEHEYDELRGRTELTAAERSKTETVTRLELREREARDGLTFVRRDLDQLAGTRRELLDQKEGWDGRSVAEAADADERTQDALSEATLTRRGVARRHETDVTRLAEAQAGEGGPAGRSLAALSAAGLVGVPLLDNLRIDDAARDRWEPRLWPHRSAVVVAPNDEGAALATLAAVPGSSLVVADGPLDGGGAEHDGVVASVPMGRFLAALAVRTEYRDDPARAIDAGLGEATLGGFAAPVAGRAARVAAARTAADASADELEVAADTERLARLRAQESAAQLAAARAARDLDALVVAENRLRVERQEREAAVSELVALLVPAKAEQLEAAAIARNHVQQVRLAWELLKLVESEGDEAMVRLRNLQNERAQVALEYWASGWAGTADEALALLAEQPVSLSTVNAASLRRRAAEELKDALDSYLRGVPERDIPPDLAEARARRQQLADGGVGGDSVDFTTVARPLRDQLDGLAERDEIQSDRIHREQARRADELDALQQEVARLDGDLQIVQDMVASSVDAALSAISTRLDVLNRRRGGFGAELRVIY